MFVLVEPNSSPHSRKLVPLAAAGLALLLLVIYDGSKSESTSPERRNLRVLVAIDTSGTMNKPVSPNDSLKRIEAAVGGARAGLRHVKPPYELGVWSFRQGGHTVLAPIEPATSGRLNTVADKLGALPGRQRSDGGTPLYNTITDGVAALQLAGLGDNKPEDTISVLVVLTDGRDHPPRAMIQAGSAKTAIEVESAVTKAENVRVLVTAAFTRCGSLFAEVPTIEKSCLSVSGTDDIKRRLSDILARLEAARVPAAREARAGSLTAAA